MGTPSRRAAPLASRPAKAHLVHSLNPTCRGRSFCAGPFEIDVLACPECGGRLRLLATIEDPAVVRKILPHLGIATECRPPPESTASFDFGSH
jgi:hypothetical protein